VVPFGARVELDWNRAQPAPGKLLLRGGRGLELGPTPVQDLNRPWLEVRNRTLFSLETEGSADCAVVEVAARGMDFLAGDFGGKGYKDGNRRGTAWQQPRFVAPAGLARDDQGNTYVSDAAAHTIRKINRGGRVTTLAGGAGLPAGYEDLNGTAARFNTPRGLAVALETGIVYVADCGNDAIRMVRSDGTVSTLDLYPNADGKRIGKELEIRRPAALALDLADRHLFVAEDVPGGRILRVELPSGLTEVLDLGRGLANGGTGLAVCRDAREREHLYVAEADSHLILDVPTDRPQQAQVLAGVLGAAGGTDGVRDQARFNRPCGLHVHPTGFLVVVDSGSGAIRSVTLEGVDGDPYGQVRTLFSSPAREQDPGAGLNQPDGLALESARTLLVADSRNGVLRRIEIGAGGGPVLATWAGPRPAPAARVEGRGPETRFASPTAIAVAADGDAFVADHGNRVIRRVTPAGVVSTWARPNAEAPFRNLAALVAAPDGTVFATDADAGIIIRFSADGAATRYAGVARWVNVTGAPMADGPRLTARFQRPRGLLRLGDGTLVVTDGNCLRRIDPVSGLVTTLAGSHGEAGLTDAPLGSARFNQPWGLALGPDGFIYVADMGNHVIRRVSPDGRTVGTWAGPDDGQDGTAALASPRDLAFGRDGGLYVVGHHQPGVLRIHPGNRTIATVVEGAESPLASDHGRLHADGVEPAVTARLLFGWGLAVTREGDLLVTVCDQPGTSGGVMQITEPLAEPAPDHPDRGNLTWGLEEGDLDRLFELDPPAGAGGAADGREKLRRLGEDKADGTQPGPVPESKLPVAAGSPRRVPVPQPAPQPAIHARVVPFGARVDLAQELVPQAPGSMLLRASHGLEADPVRLDQLQRDDLPVRHRTIFSLEPSESGGIASQTEIAVRGMDFLAGDFGGKGYSDGHLRGSAWRQPRFLAPAGLARDKYGNTYVCDDQAHTIRKISWTGQVTTLAGGAGQQPGCVDDRSSEARFDTPISLAVAADGSILFVADHGNDRIRAVYPDGAVTTLEFTLAEESKGAGQVLAIRRPRAVALDGTDPHQHLYVAEDGPAGRILRVDLSSRTATVLALPQGLVIRASALAVRLDAQGREHLYVADDGAHTILDVPTAQPDKAEVLAGQPGEAAHSDGIRTQARFSRPSGLHLDAHGNLLVVDAVNGAIRRVTTKAADGVPAGRVETLLHAKAPMDAPGLGLNRPQGLVLDGDHGLLVADRELGVLWRIDLRPGEVPSPKLWAGTLPAQPAATDGLGSEARFAMPMAITVAGNGDAFLVDNGNRVIRRVTPAGRVSTWARPTAEAPFQDLRGLVAAPDGTLFATDAEAGIVIRIDGNGVATRYAGAVRAMGQAAASAVDGPRLTGARFHEPLDLLRLDDGTLIVVDRHCLRRIDPVTGAVTTLAGNPAEDGLVNAPQGEARFRFPRGLAQGPDGFIYVADMGNDVIRRVSPDGRDVRTWAGQENAGEDTDLVRPAALAFGRDGWLYVGCGLSSGVLRIHPGNRSIETLVAGADHPLASDHGRLHTDAAEPADSARIRSVRGLAATRQGDLLVTVCDDDLVSGGVMQITEPPTRISPDDEPSWRAGSPASDDDDDLDRLFDHDPSGAGSPRSPRSPESRASMSPRGGGQEDPRIEEIQSHLLLEADLLKELRDGIYQDRQQKPPSLAISVPQDPAPEAVSESKSPVHQDGGFGAPDDRDGNRHRAPSEQPRFGIPVALARDANGNTYVSDTEAHTIRKIGRDGQVTTLAGGTDQVGGYRNGPGTDARFNTPFGLAVKSDGSILYVADLDNHRIRTVRPDGTVRTLRLILAIASQDADPTLALHQPVSLLLDEIGNRLFVAESGPFGRILLVDLSTRMATVLLPAGFTSEPLGLALGQDAKGHEHLYVADAERHVILDVPTAQPEYTGALAGQSDKAGSGDGIGTEAQFNAPSALLFDASGCLLVLDSENGAIRRVATEAAGRIPARQVKTLFRAKGTPDDPVAGMCEANGLVMDEEQGLLVADAGLGVLWRIGMEPDHKLSLRLWAGTPPMRAGRAGSKPNEQTTIRVNPPRPIPDASPNQAPLSPLALDTMAGGHPGGDRNKLLRRSPSEGAQEVLSPGERYPEWLSREIRQGLAQLGQRARVGATSPQPDPAQAVVPTATGPGSDSVASPAVPSVQDPTGSSDPEVHRPSPSVMTWIHKMNHKLGMD
jgi:sugar lactone lactonase YvrE